MQKESIGSWDTELCGGPTVIGLQSQTVNDFSWGPKSEKWPILWGAFQAKETTHLRPEYGFPLSQWPEHREKNEEWLKRWLERQAEADHKRPHGKETWTSYSQGNGKPLENYKTGVTWLYFFLNPGQLYEEKFGEMKREEKSRETT